MNDDARRVAQAAQWALARVKPDYAMWPDDAQELYRCAMSDEDRLVVDIELLESLFGIRAGTQEELSAALDSLEQESRLLYSDAALLTAGIGEDFFWSLDVRNYTGQHVAAFETLYDFDKAQHAEQGRRDPRRTRSVYRGEMRNDWARLRIDGKFSYASLSMAASYIAGLIEQFGGEHGEKVVDSAGWPGGPGENVSKRQIRRNQGEMVSRLCRYADQRCETLLSEFDQNPRKTVFILDTSTKNYPDTHFLFSDKTALREIRFRYFVRDCRALRRPISELGEVIERERRAAIEVVERSYEDILRHPAAKR